MGRRKTHLMITLGSVLGSVLLVTGFFVWFGGTRAEAPMYFVPAVVVPMVVAPLASARILDLAFDLDAAHATMADQAAQLEALLLAAPIGLAELAPDGTVRRSNAAALALMGEHPQASAWSARFVHPSERDALLAAVRSGQAQTGVRSAWHLDTAGTRLVETHLAPIGHGRATTGAILVLSDITDREAANAALASARQLELVGRLAGGMAHDFNNLLTIIRANASAIRAGDRQAAVQAIDEASESGGRLTRRLLAISGRNVHIPERQAIAPIIIETLTLMGRLLPSGVQLERPGPLPDVSVLVDRDAVQQALLNLLVNARDAVGGQGTLRLFVEERTHEDRHWLVVSVRDDGAGMSPEVLARATEPFFTTKASHEGTGLGLPMVRDTMQRHGGRLELESAPGAGTTAALWLPDPQPLAAAPAATPAPNPAETPILLVDDEAPVRDATAKLLRRLGYKATVAASAAEARHVLETEPIALVISDVMMPGETGLDLLQSLRDAGRRLPVLLVSGYTAEAVERAVAADANAAFLAKPWSLSDLEGRLHALLAPVAARR